mgnify:CR=1 FL=1
MVIDGGFSEAYHSETGIAGYTLVYHSRGFQLVQHEPFTSASDAIRKGTDIKSTTQLVELSTHRMHVADTDKSRRCSRCWSYCMRSRSTDTRLPCRPQRCSAALSNALRESADKSVVPLIKRFIYMMPLPLMSAVHKRRLHVVSVSIVCSHCDAHWMWA